MREGEDVAVRILEPCDLGAIIRGPNPEVVLLEPRESVPESLERDSFRNELVDRAADVRDLPTQSRVRCENHFSDFLNAELGAVRIENESERFVGKKGKSQRVPVELLGSSGILRRDEGHHVMASEHVATSDTDYKNARGTCPSRRGDEPRAGAPSAADNPLYLREVPASGEQMKWVTREKAKVDRIACPWLILHFVDPNAEFLFVPADQVGPVSKSEGAIPFDAPGIELTHYKDRGEERVSFDAIIRKYKLTDRALLDLAEIVRTADAMKAARRPRPEGAGLEAAALGFRQIARDDHENMRLQLPLYDALYAYCRSRIEQGGRLEPAT